MPNDSPSRFQTIILSLPVQLAILGIAVALTYGHTLDAPFNFDGLGQIKANPVIRHLDDLRALWRYSPQRIVGFFSFALNYHFHQLDVAGYHLVNISIHLLAAGAMFWLLRGLLRSPAATSGVDGLQAVWLPLLAALLFAVHPLQTQAVTYIVQRFESLAALFYIGALACYVQARLEAIPLRRWSFGVVAVLAAGLAFFTKQNSATLPLAILLVEVIFFTSSPRRALVKVTITGLAMTVIFVVLATIVRHSPPSLADLDSLTRETRDISRWHYLATQLLVLFIYIKLFFLPWGLHPDYDLPLAESLLAWPVPLAAVLHLAVICLAAARVRRFPIPAFGILFYYLAHLVTSSIIPIRDVVFEHRTYLPNLGLGVAVAWSLLALAAKMRMPRRFAVVIVCLLAILATLTVMRNNVWRDPLALWQDGAERAPDSPRVHLNLGNVLQERGDLTGAIDQYEQAVAVDPVYQQAHYNLGYALVEQGEFGRAMFHYREALRLRPDDRQTLNNLATLMAQSGRLDEAAAHFEKLLDIDPGYATGHYNLGKVFMEQGRDGEAADHFLAALELNPSYAEAAKELGILCHRQGDLDRAALYYRQTLETTPEDVDLRFNLGLILGRQGRLPEALAQFGEALRLAPGHDQARRFYDLTAANLDREAKE